MPRFKALPALLMAGLFHFAPQARAAEAPEPTPTAVAAESGPARRPAAAPSPQPSPTPLVSLEDFKRLEQDAAGLHSAQQGMKKDLGGLEEQVQKLAKWQSEQAPQIKTLSQIFEETRQDLSAGLKKVEEVRQSIERKGEVMQGLLDLLSTLKRDVNDNSHEIALIKQDLDKLRASLKAPPESMGPLEKLARWPYMPLAAAVLSGIAIGVAASK